MIKLVIFDFDGTIVDSKGAYYNSIIKSLEPFGFAKEKIIEGIDEGLSLSDTLRKFVPSTLYRWSMRKMIMKNVLKEANDTRKCHDVNHIREIKIEKILISNSLSEFVIPVLKHFKMNKVFREVYCADNFDNKTKFMQDYLKKRKIKPSECFYVGDRVADVTLSKKIKCHNIIVYGKCAWNSKDEIIESGPEFIVPDLRDVKRIVEKFKD